MFGLDVPELVLILIIGLVVFGPSKLPDIGRALGKSLHDFKAAENDAKDMINVTPQKPAEKEAPKAKAPSDENK